LIHIRRMESDDLHRLAEIDRSERVRVGYAVYDGQLVSRIVDWDVPPWLSTGQRDHTVRRQIAFCRQQMRDNGGILFGAFDETRLVGVALLRPHLTAETAQLAFLHVSRELRRQGIGTRLLAECLTLARELGSSQIYVSATPSASAVGFYRSLGFQLAGEVHAELFAAEPEDIHMVLQLT